MGPNLQSNMRIIDRAQQKIKQFLSYSKIDDVMWVLIIMFVALCSFSLGMIYERRQYNEQNPITIQYSKEALDMWNNYQSINQQHQNFFASKNGSIVYPMDCSAGNRVKEENRVYFSELEQAFEQGYRESDSC
jgi:hypothetical protein